MDSIVQLITVIIIFLLVLVITYFTTRWLGNISRLRLQGRNIEMIDGGRITPTQHIQIVRVGRRYFILGVSKDNISVIAECSEDDIELDKTEGSRNGGSAVSFQDVLSRIGDRFKNK